MYEHFKQDILSRLSNSLDSEALCLVEQALDTVSVNYSIDRAEALPAVQDAPGAGLLKTFLVCKRLEGLSEGTLQNYHIALSIFFNTIRKEPERITSNDIRVYLYQYQSERGISDRSLDKLRQTLCGFFHWAYTEEYILKDITLQIHPIKHEVKPRQALTQLQLEYVRSVCQSPRDRAILEFFYSTGCRVSELCVVKLSDLDGRTGTVKLFGKGRKHRISYINAKAAVALSEYLKVRPAGSEYLFVADRAPHGQLTKCGVEKIIRRLSDDSYPLTGIHFSPHHLRHTTATAAVQNGMPINDVSKLLGHAQISTTMIYAETAQEHVQSEHKRCVI